MFFESMHPNWQVLLSGQKKALFEIEQRVLGTKEEITPALEHVMRAFYQDPHRIKLLIIGQDPYPTRGAAIGLAFAVGEGIALPASLKNLMTELKSDINKGVSANADLHKWVDQGVMLLNATLTTSVGVSEAHKNYGWDLFTAAAVKALDEYLDGKLVCLSLGLSARKTSKVISKGFIIEATHPSPLSAHRGFFGSKIFSRVNLSLIELGLEPIDWSC
jgi:uracil-DNA glycosylase